MKKSAVVRFIGNQEEYRLHCDESNYKYCRDCKSENCQKEPRYLFIHGGLYNAYFLEYWQGDRNSLHVKGEDGEVHDFIPYEEFEVVSDEDNVLNTHEAIVRCITHEYDDELFDLNYGKEYKAIGFDSDGLYLVMDECYDCYFYSSEYFEIVADPYCVLDKTKSTPIYDWENTHIDSVVMDKQDDKINMDRSMVISIMQQSDGERIRYTDTDGNEWTGYVDVYESDYDNQDDERKGHSLCVQRDDGANIILYDDEIKSISILK